MRLEFDVGGYGRGISTTFEVFNSRMFKFGRDDLLTVMFCRNLNDSIIRGLCGTFGSNVNSETLISNTAKRSISRIQENKSHCRVIIDVWVETRNGRKTYFCKIGNGINDVASIGTLNTLPLVSRMCYGFAYVLKKSPPPKGYEPLRGINLIKNYEENSDSEEMIYIGDGKMKMSDSYIEKHKEEIEELKRKCPELFNQNSVDKNTEAC